MCAPGKLECDAQPPRRCGVDGRWQTTTCGPLLAADVTGLDTTGLPGFNIGLRCKSLSVCSPGQGCIYYAENLGSVQSSETTYTDGSELPQAAATRVYIATGAQSMCGNPAITLTAAQKLLIAHDGQSHTVYFPAITATELTLYIREDGATFYDAALTNVAQRAP